ncbi:N-6 DNA methylase [Halalkalicoccus ordinarius]|uniref:N-6 DNA methylase n=1 Tax=Halalkalicoccus ordinarius TaxID=3116651 RepID=UPI00300EA5FB
MIQREELLRKELEHLQGIGNIEIDSPSVLELIDANTLVIVSSERFRGPTPNQIVAEYNVREFDQVLVVLEDVILDVAPSPLLIYPGDYSIEDPHSVATHLEAILHGQQSPSVLDTADEDLLVQLQEAELLSYQTPAAAAELLINWTTTGQRRTILNAGCGIGQILVEIRDQLTSNEEDTPDYSLWGIDTSRIASEIAQNCLGEDATILTSDFLEFQNEHRQTTLEDVQSRSSNTESIPAFDAVISHPPAVRTSSLPESTKETIRDRFSCRRLDQAFVLHSLSLLRNGGHGAFLLPQSSLTEKFLKSIQSRGRIHCLTRLTNAEFLAQGIEPVLLFLERTEMNSGVDDSIRLLRVDSTEITPEHIGLLHGHADNAVNRAQGINDVSIVAVSPDEIDPDLLPLALNAPEAVPFLFSETFDELGLVAQPCTGLTTGANQFFYFEREERDESAIPDELFTPVLRKLSPESHRITERDITWYLLDLRGIVKEAREDISPSDEFLDWLAEQGYPSLVDYISEFWHRFDFDQDHLDTLIPSRFTDRVRNPDLVTQGIFSLESPAQPEWWLVDINEEVVFDSTVVGIHCEEETPPLALWSILNIPLYQRIQKDSMPLLRNDPNYARFRIRELQSLPIIESCLSEEFAQEMKSLLPVDSAHKEITLRNRIIEACSPAERAAVDAAFEAFSQHALTWFLSGEELEKFRERIEGDDNPEEFLLEQFGDDVLSDVQYTFSRTGLFEGRREVLLDLVELFDQERYQTFLVGLASQFEGVLVDYVEETGGRIEFEIREVEQDGEMTEIEVLVFYRPGRQEGKKKDLKRLFDEFFEGEYLRYLQETVRERRNELAHGSLVDNPEQTAVVLLVTFFGMINNILHRYNRHLARVGE